MSRPQVQQARSRLPFQVATSWTTKPCRDTNPMSRLQFPTGQVATSVPCRDLLETNPCRDIKSMSRPPTLSPMSQHQIHVATPFLLTVGFPGRDAKSQVATSYTTTHVATSKMMSRHQLSSAPFLQRRDAIFPCRDLPYCHPCRDLKMMLRHQY